MYLEQFFCFPQHLAKSQNHRMKWGWELWAYSSCLIAWHLCYSEHNPRPLHRRMKVKNFVSIMHVRAAATSLLETVEITKNTCIEKSCICPSAVWCEKASPSDNITFWCLFVLNETGDFFFFFNLPEKEALPSDWFNSSPSRNERKTLGMKALQTAGGGFSSQQTEIILPHKASVIRKSVSRHKSSA